MSIFVQAIKAKYAVFNPCVDYLQFNNVQFVA